MFPTESVLLLASMMTACWAEAGGGPGGRMMKVPEGGGEGGPGPGGGVGKTGFGLVGAGVIVVVGAGGFCVAGGCGGVTLGPTGLAVQSVQ